MMGELSKDRGWHRHPTGQDAEYFGVFFNDTLMSVYTYAEGDHCQENYFHLKDYRIAKQEHKDYYNKWKDKE